MRSRAGYSIVEVIVALTLLSVGLLAAAASGTAAMRLLQDAHISEQVAMRAATIADSLLAPDSVVAGSGRTDFGTYIIDWTLTGDSLSRAIDVRASWKSLGQPRLLTFMTAAPGPAWLR